MDFFLEFLIYDFLHKPVWLWIAFMAIVFVLVAFDLGVLHRKAHEIELRESFLLSAGYIFLACLFGCWVWGYLGPEAGANYFTGYFIEKSLSMDNLFVMSLIFLQLGIPRLYQHRVLFWGIIGVLLLRGVTIALGAALIERFDWILFFFGAFLLYTGIHMLFTHDDDEEFNVEDSRVLRFLRKHLKITDRIRGDHFFVRETDTQTGHLHWFATPLFVALCMIEIADLIFAVDSIPAIFAITTDPYIVFTSNIFAILGLRALYFALAAMLHRFHYLKYSLSIILALIGAKIFYTHFFGKIDPLITLSLTLGLLAAGVLFSMYRTSRDLREK